jgi:hypothetical protein
MVMAFSPPRIPNFSEIVRDVYSEKFNELVDSTGSWGQKLQREDLAKFVGAHGSPKLIPAEAKTPKEDAKPTKDKVMEVKLMEWNTTDGVMDGTLETQTISKTNAQLLEMDFSTWYKNEDTIQNAAQSMAFAMMTRRFYDFGPPASVEMKEVIGEKKKSGA